MKPILNYYDDDGWNARGTRILRYLLSRLVLVNGGKGIGTGFSYEGPSYSPTQIMKYLKNKINKTLNDSHVIEPYYEDFKGKIIKLSPTKFLIKGVYEIVSHDTVRIKELPIGTWTSTYKAFLETLMDDKPVNGKKKKKPIVKNYVDSCTDTTIEFTVKLHTGMLPDLISKSVTEHINQFEKTFKLTTTKSTTNMYLFDKDQKLVKYNTVYEIIDQYYGVRYNAYIKRKENIIATLEKQLVILSNRAKFIHEQIVEPPTLVMRKKKKAEVIDMLKTKNYAVIDGDEEYKYLRSMTIDSVEEENYKRLVKEREDKEVELEQIKKMTIEKMWLSELTELEQAYVKYRNYRTIRQKGVGAKIKKKNTKKSKKK